MSALTRVFARLGAALFCRHIFIVLIFSALSTSIYAGTSVIPVHPLAENVEVVATAQGYDVVSWVGRACPRPCPVVGVVFERYDLSGRPISEGVHLGPLDHFFVDDLHLVSVTGGYQLFLTRRYTTHTVIRLDEDGGAMGSPNPFINSIDAGAMDALAVGDGTLVVYSELTRGFRPYSQKIENDGSISTDRRTLDYFTFYLNGGYWVEKVRIQKSNAGFLAVWPRNDNGIYARRLKMNGEPKGELLKIDEFFDFDMSAAPLFLKGREFVVYSRAKQKGDPEDLYLRELMTNGDVSDAMLLTNSPESEGVAGRWGSGLHVVGYQDRFGVFFNVISDSGSFEWKFAEFALDGTRISPYVTLSEEVDVTPDDIPNLIFDPFREQYVIAVAGKDDKPGGFLVLIDPVVD